MYFTGLPRGEGQQFSMCKHFLKLSYDEAIVQKNRYDLVNYA